MSELCQSHIIMIPLNYQNANRLLRFLESHLDLSINKFELRKDPEIRRPKWHQTTFPKGLRGFPPYSKIGEVIQKFNDDQIYASRP
jgi:hypothetical protein